MSDDLKEHKRRMADERIKKTIVNVGCTITPEEAQAEMNAATWDEQVTKASIDTGRTLTPEEEQAKMTTAADYDEWVMSAFVARTERRIQLGGVNVEHPTTKLFRIGIESIKAGKPSPIFLSLLEQIADRAELRDVLRLVFPESIPSSITKTQMDAADDYARVADEFREYVKNSDKKLTFKEIKKKFKEDMGGNGVGSHIVDDALKAHGLDFEVRRKKGS